MTSSLRCVSERERDIIKQNKNEGDKKNLENERKRGRYEKSGITVFRKRGNTVNLTFSYRVQTLFIVFITIADNDKSSPYSLHVCIPSIIIVIILRIFINEQIYISSSCIYP